MAIIEHPAFLVYKNLKMFLKSRKLDLVDGKLDATRDRFVVELNHIGYRRLVTKDFRQRVVVVLLLAPQGKYTEHGPQLRGLIEGLNGESFAREGNLEEVIVVAPEEVAQKKNMEDVIRKFRTHAGSEGALAAHYNMYPYHTFSLNILRARIVPRHTIVSNEEIQGFLSREHLAISDLKKIQASSPPVVWIGARPRQVVRIDAPSETAGQTQNYYLVSGV